MLLQFGEDATNHVAAREYPSISLAV